MRALSLPELWIIIASYIGLVGAWRLTGVCKAAREGAKRWLRTLPGLVVSGGCVRFRDYLSDVWRLDMESLQWERLPSLTDRRGSHVCCAVRGGVVVLGGQLSSEVVDFSGQVPSVEMMMAHIQEFGPLGESSASVEILGHNSAGSQVEGNTFRVLPPLSCGRVCRPVAVEIDESESDQGQVLLLGGKYPDNTPSPTVLKVDLATGQCTAQPPLLSPQGHLVDAYSAARLPNGRIVCVGVSFPIPSDEGVDDDAEIFMAQILEPPPHGSPKGAGWQWRWLPKGLTFGRLGGGGCTLSDGRFAVFGGVDPSTQRGASTCEALTLSADGDRWEMLPRMHEGRRYFACVAIGRCVVVAGGQSSMTAEVYEESMGRWRRLPCSLPHDGPLFCVASALM